MTFTKGLNCGFQHTWNNEKLMVIILNPNWIKKDPEFADSIVWAYLVKKIIKSFMWLHSQSNYMDMDAHWMASECLMTHSLMRL